MVILLMLIECDFLVGYGEVVKYGLFGDVVFFDWLEQNGLRVVVGDMDVCVYVVEWLVQMKVDIVLCDEKEYGDWVLLNFGYIFCYVLENVIGYFDWLLYGEGVVIGCVFVFELLLCFGFCS